jgi:hypothetical protein
MRRRDFIMLLGGAAVAWPVGARAQQPARPRLVGVLLGFSETETSRALVGEFRGALANAGWKEDRALRIELRWGGGDVERIGAAAKELIALQTATISPNPAVLSPTGPTSPKHSGKRRDMWIAFSKEQILPSCPSSSRRSSNSLSTSRLPLRSVSQSRRTCWRSPTR